MKTDTTPPRIRLKRSKPILDLTLPDQQEHANRMLEYSKNKSPEIEKGIPIPDRLTAKGQNHKYRFKDMDVGDSYFRAGNPKAAANALRQSILNFKKRIEQEPDTSDEELREMDFVIQQRNMEEHNEIGARIWRRV